MRAAPLIALTGALLVGCAQAPAPISVQSAGRVVFPPGSGSPFIGTPAWIPSAADVAACEAALGRELATRKKDLARYYVRLCGAEGSEGRLIVGDACRIDTPNAQHYLTPPDRDTIALATFGGGEAFFRFQYDPATGKLTEFHFNAAL